MSRKEGESARCAVLAVPHGGLSEGIRGLLSTLFESVVLVADEASLLACLAALRPELLVLDVALVPGGAFELVQRLRGRFQELRILLLVADDEPALERLATASGADGCLLKRSLGSDLLEAVDVVQSGRTAFWSSGFRSAPARNES